MTLFPYTTLFRSLEAVLQVRNGPVLDDVRRVLQEIPVEQIFNVCHGSRLVSLFFSGGPGPRFHADRTTALLKNMLFDT
jgi:hypothetical protein